MIVNTYNNSRHQYHIHHDKYVHVADAESSINVKKLSFEQYTYI